MGSFGENLRREREMRGISLQEICQATKIGVRMLDAIETDRFDRLPGGVFNRGFVRQYARYLGLDEDRVLADFGVAPAAAPEQQQVRTVALVEGEAEPRNIPLLVFGALVVLAALVAGGWRLLRRAEPPRPAPVKQAAPQVPAPAPQPSAVAPPIIEGLNLQLEATDRCWITVSADGRPAWKAPMKPGESRSITAASALEVQVDNAAALNVTLNGEVQPSLGRKDEARTVTYSKAGLEQKGKRP